MEQFARRGPVRKNDLITVRLTCGCQVTARNPPLHNKATYICAQGHGYRRNWNWYRNPASDMTRNNPLHPLEPSGE